LELQRLLNGEGAARPVTDFRDADNIDVAWVAIAD
jgi:hypothetical protein